MTTPADELGQETLRLLRLIAYSEHEPPLDRLRALRLLVRHWDAMVHRVVSDSRGRGCTWQQIADALGVSRQAVAKRFGGNGDAE